MAGNPLQQYFRQPKIYIKLPTSGIYSPPGTIQGDINSLPVFGMSGMDEIIMKTPDALLSGESVVKIIQSCCPSITNAWALSALDTEMILTAIRIATYGNKSNVDHTCPTCNTENSYDIDLGFIIEHFAKAEYQNSVVLKDFAIKTQPLSYKHNTEFGLRNFKVQQQLRQVSDLEDEEKQKEIVAQLFEDLAKIQVDIFTEMIESIEFNNTVVNQKPYIKEWLENCDKDVYDRLKEQITQNKLVWEVPVVKVKCEECNSENSIKMDMDYANFFANA
jgi:hypothetical protein